MIKTIERIKEKVIIKYVYERNKSKKLFKNYSTNIISHITQKSEVRGWKIT